MMIHTVRIRIMPHKELLDPQGKAVLIGMHQLNLGSVTDVRVGKNIELQVEANNPEEAVQIASTAATQLLANPVMEVFDIELLSS
ncbi:MAG: phosphoribosylformylglycinamidine synthase subunit PurS [Ferruginibacter sp.]